MDKAQVLGRKRYVTLDGMRGTAAFAVVFYHFGLYRAHLFPSGYLAVDLFFALSGFVISLKYARRLATHLSAVRFFEMRLIRLYPLYLAGLIIGAMWASAAEVHFHRGAGIVTLFFEFLLGCAVLPDPLHTPNLFPLNIPAWSLFFELLVNVTFAYFLVHWRSRFVVVLVAIAGAGLLAVVGPPMYFDMGSGWENAFGGLLRTFFSFGVGILIARHFPTERSSNSWVALVPVIVLTAVLARSPSGDRRLIESGVVLVLFPLLLTTGIRFEPPAPFTKVFGFLGDISYAVYALHGPILGFVTYLASKFHFSVLAAAGVYFLLVIGIAALAVHFFDVPVRRSVTQALRLRRSEMPILI